MENCLVVCSQDLGKLPASVVAGAEDAFVIAVNGGIANALKLRLRPTLWVGDGDSLKKKDAKQALSRATKASRAGTGEEIPLIKLPPEKDYSDLEAALHVARENLLAGTWSGDVILLGAQGGRFDHDVINLLAAHAWLTDVSGQVGAKACPDVVSMGPHGIWIGTVKNVEFEQPKGKVFSVFSLNPDAKVSVNGARYNSKSARVGLGAQGLSNEGLGKLVKLKISAGPVFVVFPTEG